MTDIRLVTMSGSRPFICLEKVVHETGVPRDTWMQWLLDERECSVMFLRSQAGTFVEASSLEGIVRRMCTPKICAAWMHFCRTNKTRRRLTDAEKKKVAAEQKWVCAECACALDETYEVDHIEQHAIRANNTRANLQALCPRCHRSKTVQDRYFGDPLFETPGYHTTTVVKGANGNLFSSYFMKT